MTASQWAENNPEVGPSSPASGLPPRYLPRVARHAPGPFIERLVTPSDFGWKGTRTYLVEDYDGIEWRCLRVTTEGPDLVGYWAVERLGLPLVVDPNLADGYSMVGHDVVSLSPTLHTRWRGRAIAYTGAPSLLIELYDGRRIMLPVGWTEIVE